jgi:hypothetical protein
MRKHLLIIAAGVLLAIPAQVEAQFTLGGGIAWHDDFDLGVGVYGYTPLPALHENVHIGGDFTYFFPDIDNLDYLEVNANLVYSFPMEGSISPFLLGGLNIARISVDTGVSVPGFSFDASATEVGLNLGGGIVLGLPDSSFRPLVGAKIELSGGEGLVVFGGVGFPIGG